MHATRAQGLPITSDSNKKRHVYTYYYDVPEGPVNGLTCGRLAARVIGELRGHYPAIARDTAQGARSPKEALEDAAAALGDQRNWAAVSRMRWALYSDRALTPRELAQVGSKEYEHARAAIRALSAAFLVVYPDHPCKDHSTLGQLVALGEDMTRSVGADPSLLGYVEKELQPIDLASVVWT
jgi:hypothetical protein